MATQDSTKAHSCRVFTFLFFSGIFLAFIGIALTIIGFGKSERVNLKVIGPLLIAVGGTMLLTASATYLLSKESTGVAKEAPVGTSQAQANQTDTRQYVSCDGMESVAPLMATAPALYTVGEAPYPQNHPYPIMLSSNVVQAPYPNITPGGLQPAHRSQGAQAVEDPPSYYQATKEKF